MLNLSLCGRRDCSETEISSLVSVNVTIHFHWFLSCVIFSKFGNCYSRFRCDPPEKASLIVSVYAVGTKKPAV